MSTDLVLSKINSAKAFLAEALDVQQVKHVMALADAAAVYGRHVSASIETINQAAEVRLRAERRLGELLRETPKATGAKGIGKSAVPNGNHTPTLADAGITKKLSSRAQELAAVPIESFEEALVVPDGAELNHNRVVSELKENRQRAARHEKRVEAAKAAPALDSRIIVGDFREHADKVADGSISLIFTDPPYDREGAKTFPALAEFAAAKLSEGGSLLCYIGQTKLFEASDAFRSHLRYWWTIACVHSGRRTVMREYGINCGWKAVLWFVKGTRDNNSIMVADTMSGGEEKSHHDWQQSQSEAEYWIEKLCPVDGIVCDPFIGGGTTAAAAKKLGREWIGFEINEEQAKIAGGRVAS